MKKVIVKVKGDAIIPLYKTPLSAGCDLVNNGWDMLLEPGERGFIHTGISIALPDGYEAQVRGRSGLNKNYGLVVPVGTIDADYRGEIGVVIYNHSQQPYQIRKGDRIAQLIISPVVQAEWEVVETLEETERGEGGFGSTGK